MPLSKYLLEELLQGTLSLGNQQDIANSRLVLLQVNVPEVAERQLRQYPLDAQAPHQLLPVALLHCVRLEFRHQHVHLLAEQWGVYRCGREMHGAVIN